MLRERLHRLRYLNHPEPFPYYSVSNPVPDPPASGGVNVKKEIQAYSTGTLSKTMTAFYERVRITEIGSAMLHYALTVAICKSADKDCPSSTVSVRFLLSQSPP